MRSIDECVRLAGLLCLELAVCCALNNVVKLSAALPCERKLM